MSINSMYSSANSGNMMNASSSSSLMHNGAFGVPGLGSMNNNNGIPGGTGASFARGTDPNSPEMFKQNVKVALQYVELIERLAKSASTGIEYAFREQPLAPGQQPSSNPIQAAEDITSLRDCLDAFADFLAQTGVGALPLPSPSTATIVSPTTGAVDEEKLMKMTTARIEKLYAMQRQIQENNGVAANLLVAAGSSAESSSSGLTGLPPRESLRR
ncbi:hypothetical protein SCHPADRAFT_938400 [Schizopora paradoxa]|uniref:Uncharacterized protein n=1 Tax=Schizopora paradoxa TaxID=27342 RepID=A0A0H2SFE5_9AGAM|nr:hypothetical protein SCHPADRAFT_938400 [Schizopora paradoxa]